jgi:fructose-1,6-bisphosphatase-3
MDAVCLRALKHRFPSVETALAEIAHLQGVRTLPRPTIHVVSDVHGEFRKLEHILRNGSGSLRPLVERSFAGVLDAREQQSLLQLIYYPREAFHLVSGNAALVRDTILRELLLLRRLAARYSLRHTRRVFPPALEELFSELLVSSSVARDPEYVDALIRPFVADDGGLELLRATSHALRALAVYELVVAGDLGDRGPRIDRVIDTLRAQRNVFITWGNHDAEWMGACLGQEALVATVLRLSLRYGRLAQLEEGYGIPVEPLEQLAASAYARDPAERFRSKGTDLRDPTLIARMHKAIAILQFKLEGQTTRRNPEFELDGRNLLHRIDPRAGTVTIDGVHYPLLDASFPTIDWREPYRLSEDEARCMDLLRRSFTDSATLWEDMQFVVDRGGMFAVRDEHVIFHGCVPVDEGGRFIAFLVDGEARSGRALFDAFERVVRRAFRKRAQKDVDALYYLWAGPRSPLFGKDRMATFENYFVADERTHRETKNPYFHLLHEAAFCLRVAQELGVTADKPLVVNGHVPVKIDQGESPLKRSGLAVTIDGAFSEAYGDHGYTLVIDADRTYLAKHHHFERGTDIVPDIVDLRTSDPPRLVRDTPQGLALQSEIAGLEELVTTYENNPR